MLKRIFQIGLMSLLLVPLSLFAADIECVGSATQVVNGKDTLLIFKEEVHLRSPRGYVDWYNTDGTLYMSNADEIYPDDGGFYIKDGSYESSPVYVFVYSDPAAELDITLTPECQATTLSIKGDVDPLEYRRKDGSTGTYARACTINFNALSWGGEEWVDSAAQVKSTLHEGNYNLPALYGATPIHICYDADIRIALGLDSACYEAELKAEDIIAVNMELTSLATARGEEGEKSNERNRPTSQKLIAGSEYSGPLEVAFYSNPTPAVQFYSWSIYKATQLIATRADKDIRYVFNEPGAYKVTCKVNNRLCMTDSSEVTINVSESYLAVPNVFTPNGDGKNDEFRVAYRSIREFHCWVYNRWGKLVYEWTDPAKGWDGMIGNRPAAEGAYFYVIRALGTDAPKDARYMIKPVYNKKKSNADESIIGVYELSGDINLLRGGK